MLPFDIGENRGIEIYDVCKPVFFTRSLGNVLLIYSLTSPPKASSAVVAVVN